MRCFSTGLEGGCSIPVCGIRGSSTTRSIPGSCSTMVCSSASLECGCGVPVCSIGSGCATGSIPTSYCTA